MLSAARTFNVVGSFVSPTVDTKLVNWGTNASPLIALHMFIVHCSDWGVQKFYFNFLAILTQRNLGQNVVCFSYQTLNSKIISCGACQDIDSISFWIFGELGYNLLNLGVQSSRPKRATNFSLYCRQWGIKNFSMDGGNNENWKADRVWGLDRPGRKRI